MKSSIFVCLIALMLEITAYPKAPAQTSALRQGVSVQLPATSNAVAFPAADDADAWVVAVTADGSLYFGLKPVTPAQLQEEMRITPRHRDARLYIKADARAPFAALKQALHAAHEDLFETAVLLTQQPPQKDLLRTFLLPQGLEIHLALPSASTTVVQLQDSGSTTPRLKVNDQEFPWSVLQSALSRASRGQVGTTVVIEADGGLPSAPVIRVVDLSRLTGANVAISLMGL
jgi:biopolymer transport protein ExbD